jgi:hypothetical protein
MEKSNLHCNKLYLFMFLFMVEWENMRLKQAGIFSHFGGNCYIQSDTPITLVLNENGGSIRVLEEGLISLVTW